MKDYKELYLRERIEKLNLRAEVLNLRYKANEVKFSECQHDLEKHLKQKETEAKKKK